MLYSSLQLYPSSADTCESSCLVDDNHADLTLKFRSEERVVSDLAVTIHFPDVRSGFDLAEKILMSVLKGVTEDEKRRREAESARIQ